MQLVELRGSNFAGLPDGTYSLRCADGAPARCVLITGASGAGKTAFLEAVVACKEALAPYGPAARPDERKARPDAGVHLRTRWLLDQEEMRALRLETAEVVLDTSDPTGAGPARRVFHRYAHERAIGKLDFFPAERRLPGAGVESAHLPQSVPFLIQKATRLSSDPMKYTSVRGWVAERANADTEDALAKIEANGAVFADERSSVAQELAAALEAFAPTPRLLRVTRDGDLVFGGDGLPERGTDAIPGAMRAALLFALSYAQVGHGRSAVLVDEVERGVPLGEHTRFLDALLALGGSSQVIATTSSPELLNTRRSGMMVVDLSGARLHR